MGQERQVQNVGMPEFMRFNSLRDENVHYCETRTPYL